MLNKILKIKNFDYNKINYSKQINTKLFGKNVDISFELSSNNHNLKSINHKEEINKIVRSMKGLPSDNLYKFNTKFIEDNHKEILKEFIGHSPISRIYLAYPATFTIPCFFGPHIFSNYPLLQYSTAISFCYLIFQFNKSYKRDSYKFNCFYPKITKINKFLNIEKHRKEEIYKVLLLNSCVPFEGTYTFLKEPLFKNIISLSLPFKVKEDDKEISKYNEISKVDTDLNKIMKTHDNILKANLEEFLTLLFKRLDDDNSVEPREKEIYIIKYIINSLVKNYQVDQGMILNGISLKTRLSHYSIN